MTCDILRAMQKAELRVENRERIIRGVTKEQADAENRVAHEKRHLTKIQCENKLKLEKMQFRID